MNTYFHLKKFLSEIPNDASITQKNFKIIDIVNRTVNNLLKRQLGVLTILKYIYQGITKLDLFIEDINSEDSIEDKIRISNAASSMSNKILNNVEKYVIRSNINLNKNNLYTEYYFDTHSRLDSIYGNYFLYTNRFLNKHYLFNTKLDILDIQQIEIGNEVLDLYINAKNTSSTDELFKKNIGFFLKNSNNFELISNQDIVKEETLQNCLTVGSSGFMQITNSATTNKLEEKINYVTLENLNFKDIQVIQDQMFQALENTEMAPTKNKPIFSEVNNSPILQKYNNGLHEVMLDNNTVWELSYTAAVESSKKLVIGFTEHPTIPYTYIKKEPTGKIYKRLLASYMLLFPFLFVNNNQLKHIIVDDNNGTSLMANHAQTNTKNIRTVKLINGAITLESQNITFSSLTSDIEYALNNIRLYAMYLYFEESTKLQYCLPVLQLHLAITKSAAVVVCIDRDKILLQSLKDKTNITIFYYVFDYTNFDSFDTITENSVYNNKHMLDIYNKYEEKSVNFTLEDLCKRDVLYKKLKDLVKGTDVYILENQEEPAHDYVNFDNRENAEKAYRELGNTILYADKKIKRTPNWIKEQMQKLDNIFGDLFLNIKYIKPAYEETKDSDTKDSAVHGTVATTFFQQLPKLKDFAQITNSSAQEFPITFSSINNTFLSTLTKFTKTTTENNPFSGNISKTYTVNQKQLTFSFIDPYAGKPVIDNLLGFKINENIKSVDSDLSGLIANYFINKIDKTNAWIGFYILNINQATRKENLNINIANFFKLLATVYSNNKPRFSLLFSNPIKVTELNILIDIVSWGALKKVAENIQKELQITSEAADKINFYVFYQPNSFIGPD